MIVNVRSLTLAGLVVGGVFLVSPLTAWSTNIFAWNADSTSTSAGSCLSFNGAFDTSNKVEGAASMKLAISGTSQGQVGCEVPAEIALGSGADGGWFYYRWYMQISPSYSWGSADAKLKSGRRIQTGEIPPPPATLYLHANKVYVGECPECQKQGSAAKDDPSEAVVNYDFNPASNPKVTQWQEYIIGLKKQSCVGCADGEFHLYVNGVEVGSGVTNMRYCSSSCGGWSEAWGSNMVRPLPQLNDGSGGGTLWVDDVSLDTVWNSKVSGGAAGPPTAPSSLQVK